MLGEHPGVSHLMQRNWYVCLHPALENITYGLDHARMHVRPAVVTLDLVRRAIIAAQNYCRTKHKNECPGVPLGCLVTVVSRSPAQ